MCTILSRVILETLNDVDKSVFALTSIPLMKHIKIRAEANPFDKIYDDYFLQRWISLKTQSFSYQTPPCAMKVASTVLRRGCYREVMFLSDLIV